MTNINFFDLSVGYRQSMAAAAPWLAVPAAGTRRVTAQASIRECLQQVRLRPGSQVQTKLSAHTQWLYIHAAGGGWVRRACTLSAQTERPRGGGPSRQQAGRRLNKDMLRACSVAWCAVCVVPDARRPALRTGLNVGDVPTTGMSLRLA